MKRSVTLDQDLDEELTRRYGPGAKSRFLNDAAREALGRVRMLEALDRMDAEHGSVPQAVMDEVARLPRPR